MILKGFVDSKFQSGIVAKIRMMVFAKPAKESGFDLIHRRGLFLNPDISASKRCPRIGCFSVHKVSDVGMELQSVDWTRQLDVA